MNTISDNTSRNSSRMNISVADKNMGAYGDKKPTGIDTTVPFFINDRQGTNASAFMHNWNHYQTNLTTAEVVVYWGSTHITLKGQDAKRFLYLLKDKDSYHAAFSDNTAFNHN